MSDTGYTQFVTCQMQAEGLHWWSEAPAQVGFLRAPHRHVFHIHVKLEVFHEDREVEFIQLKHHTGDAVTALHQMQHEARLPETKGPINLGSCESIAEWVANELLDKYYVVGQDPRRIEVLVLEDGENGAGCSTW